MLRFGLLAAFLLAACGSPGATTTAGEPTTPDDATEATATEEQDQAGATPGERRAVRLDLADVSFLFPLPTTAAQEASLLGAASAGPRGALLPPSIALGLPRPLSNFPRKEASDVRFLGVRVDPCFVMSREPAPCRRQIRLVGQPLADGTRSVDATVHTFYDLSETEFRDLVRRLRALKALAGTATDRKPLGVHPVIARQGLDGAYANALRTLVLDFAGLSNLTRVAVMELGRPGGSWRFSAFDVQGGTLVPDEVAGLSDARVQAFGLSDTAQDTAAFLTAPGAKLPLLLKLADLTSAPAAAVEASVVEAFAIENPKKNNPGTIDCVSCHMADRGRAQAKDIRGVTQPAGAEPYANDAFVLTFTPDGRTFESQRAFGYFDRTPSITQRVVNESAEVARAINALP